MLPNLYLGIIVLAVVCSIPSMAVAEPVAARNVSARARDADLIAVGSIVAVSDKGTETININSSSVPVHRFIATLAVTEVLKGQLSNSYISFAFFLSEARGFQAIPASQFAMFFLRRAGPEEYVVVNPYYPAVVAIPNGPVTQGNELDRVTAQLAHVLRTTTALQEERSDAVDALDTIDTPTSTAALQRATHTQNLTLKLLASAALLRRNDISTLDSVATTLLQDRRSVSEWILWKLSFAIENGVKDPQAIPTLSRLFTSRDVRVRRAATGALRHTADGDAIPVIAKALTDSDQRVRYQAVIGLAEITGQFEWRPSIDAFQSEEKRYLTHWLEWSKNR